MLASFMVACDVRGQRTTYLKYTSTYLQTVKHKHKFIDIKSYCGQDALFLHNALKVKLHLTSLLAAASLPAWLMENYFITGPWHHWHWYFCFLHFLVITKSSWSTALGCELPQNTRVSNTTGPSRISQHQSPSDDGRQRWNAQRVHGTNVWMCVHTGACKHTTHPHIGTYEKTGVRSKVTRNGLKVPGHHDAQ